MRLVVNNQEFANPAPLVGQGGQKFGREGELYVLTAEKVAKVYFPDVRTTERKRKVLALCDAYANFSDRHGGRLIGFPEYPAYETRSAFESLVGFSMRRLAYPEVVDLRFDIKKWVFPQVGGSRSR
jgi:hypothetical protein